MDNNQLNLKDILNAPGYKASDFGNEGEAQIKEW